MEPSRFRKVAYDFFPTNQNEILSELGKEKLLEDLKKILLIRNFELRAEAAYLQGQVGGFFHSYVGQEAIQTSLLRAMGHQNWFIASYRCHALALLLGATAEELMAELYGRETGNAKGRGGSMHFYTERMLGGFGIVSGQIPIATGAAFEIKYNNRKEEVAICFLGDGAVAQGTFHESLNLSSLWNLPCIFVIENNQWGMGTHFQRALCMDHLAADNAKSYNISGYTLDGMDYFNSYGGFKKIYQEVIETQRPVLVEAVTERFKGHSVSDPGLYRTKEELEKCKMRDPLFSLVHVMEEAGFLTEEEYKAFDQEQKSKVIEAMKFAEESPWPDPISLEEDVFANE